MLSNSDSNLRPYVINEDEWNRLAEIEQLLKVGFNFLKIIFIII
jgi:collagenase-like PrtC family protease